MASEQKSVRDETGQILANVLEASGQTPFLGADKRDSLKSVMDHISAQESLDKTRSAMLDYSLRFMTDQELRELERMVQADLDAKYDMRNSHKFSLERTIGNIISHRDPEILAKMRRSIKYRHHDLFLDDHARHLKDVQANRARYFKDGKAIFKRDSQIHKIKPIEDCYYEDHDLSLDLPYEKFVQDLKHNDTVRPSEVSNTHQKDKINHLK